MPENIDPSWHDEASSPPKTPRASPIIQIDTAPETSVMVPKWNPAFKIALMGVILMIIGALVFWLSEFGVLTLGIEHWWGLSNKTGEALNQMQSKITGNTFKVSGQIEIRFKENNALLRGRIFQIITPERSSLESEWTIANLNERQLSLLGPAFGKKSRLRLETIASGNTVFVRVPENQSTLWAQITTTELETLGFDLKKWPDFFATLNTTSANEGKIIAGKIVNGHRTKGFAIPISLNLVGEFINFNRLNVNNAIIRLYGGSRDRLPYLMQSAGDLTLGIEELEFNVNLFFTDFDDKSLVLATPGGDQVQKISLVDWISSNGLFDFKSSLARDAVRKTHLARIAAALRNYASAQKPFGFPVAVEEIRLDRQSILDIPLKPYLGTLPRDPLSPDFYYSYRTDETGNNFTLRARLENRSDPEGELINGQLIYELTD